jgi:hypothetical protein
MSALKLPDAGLPLTTVQNRTDTVSAADTQPKKVPLATIEAFGTPKATVSPNAAPVTVIVRSSQPIAAKFAKSNVAVEDRCFRMAVPPPIINEPWKLAFVVLIVLLKLPRRAIAEADLSRRRTQRHSRCRCRTCDIVAIHEAEAAPGIGNPYLTEGRTKVDCRRRTLLEAIEHSSNALIATSATDLKS